MNENRTYFCDECLKSRSRKTEGLTLVEIIIVLAVSGVAMLGIINLSLNVFKVQFVQSQQNVMNAEVRKFMTESFIKGTQADYFILYESVTRSDYNVASDRKKEGASGDFLLFVYTEENNGNVLINRLCGYYSDFRNVDASGRAPLNAFDVEISPASDKSPERLLRNVSIIFPNSEKQMDLVKGHVRNGHLFSNQGRHVFVMFQSFLGNDLNRVSGLHSFNISLKN